MSDPTTFLGLAANEAFLLNDQVERASLLSDIAGGYVALGEFTNARATAGSARSIATTIDDPASRVRALLTLVPVYAEIGVGAAEEILREVLQILEDAEADTIRATLLPRVVDAALLGGERTRFAVREAVDLTLIVIEPSLRADALASIGTLYQESGIGLSVTGLIQQAIPAVRSVDSELLQLSLFSRLAVLAFTAGEQALANRLSDIALKLTTHVSGRLNQEQQQFLLETIQNFERIGKSEFAPELSRFVVGGVPTGDVPPVGDELSEPIPESTLALDAPESQLAATVGLAQRLYDEGRVQDVTPLLSFGQELVLEAPDLQSRLNLMRTLVLLRVNLDQIEPITELLNGARDEYLRGMIGLFAADALIAQNRFGLADDFLVISLLASDETSFLADALRERIARRFAETGSVRLAIRTIERISDPVLRARATTSLAVIAEPAGLVTPILRADLASALASR
ncbi:MAG: hypothetical protein ACLFP4_12375 [Spirochaetales bacterium]